MAKKTKRAAVAVVEPKTPAEINKAVSDEVIKTYQEFIDQTKLAFANGLIFGSTLVSAERYLDEKCLLKTGRGSAGEGLKGWLAKNCPEINYNTAMMWKLRAEKAVKGLGNDRQAIAALGGGVTYEDDGKTIDIKPDVLDKRDKLLGCESAAKFEQMTLDLFGEGKAKGGRPKSAAEPIRKLSRKDEARKIWTDVIVILSKNSVRDAIPLLTEAKEVRVCYEKLRDLADAMKEHLDEFQD